MATIPHRDSGFTPLARSTLEAAHSGKLGFPVIMLGLLITSYFYVLPLGRFSFGGFLSDVRIYDIAFVFFMVSVGVRHWYLLSMLWRTPPNIFRSSVFLLYLVWMSIGVAYFVGGNAANIFPTLIRAFRFTAYFLAAGFVLVLVKSERDYKFIVAVIYINIVVQALLGFAQGLGWLPGFWPDYWLVGYGFQPVGTLSPHHKHIGIVMLLGLGATIGLIRSTRFVTYRFVLLGLFAIMVCVPVFAVSRTAWLGFGAGILGAVYVYRKGALSGGFVVACFLIIALMVSGDVVSNALQESVDTVFLDRLELHGIDGIVGDRLPVYSSFFANIGSYPWVVFTGAGFQNVDLVIAGTGAHNNYLQAFIELGMLGLLVYLEFLYRIWQQLRLVSRTRSPDSMTRHMAQGVAVAFIALLATMMVGESLWAQYSMFTLTGQIMTLVAVAISPLYWQREPTERLSPGTWR